MLNVGPCAAQGHPELSPVGRDDRPRPGCLYIHTSAGQQPAMAKHRKKIPTNIALRLLVVIHQVRQSSST